MSLLDRSIPNGPRRTWTALIAALLLAPACERVEELRETLRPAAPHEAYEAALLNAGLGGTALAREWSAAARGALDDAAPVTPPFRETGYLAPEQPAALGYRISGHRGRRLVVEVTLDSEARTLIFIDLFRVPREPTDTLRHMASADSGAYRLEYEPRRDEEYILRIQPELLGGGRYTLMITSDPALAFPVEGASNRSIQSWFGDPRDGGSRDHHGVDIFARRGTPALAAAPGVVTSVDTTPRGGKVVWVRDTARGLRLYYAHLDSQLVARGARVEPGDTVGLIGNTGNARTTPPHLHFGVYRRGEGPLDPYPFVYQTPARPEALAVDTSAIGGWTRATADGLRLRAAPDLDAPTLAELPRYTAMRVIAGTGRWYRVRLPDGTTGFVAARLTEAIRRPIRSEVVAAAQAVHGRPARDAVVVDRIAPAQPVPVLGRFGEYLYVQAPGGRAGWLAVD